MNSGDFVPSESTRLVESEVNRRGLSMRQSVDVLRYFEEQKRSVLEPPQRHGLPNELIVSLTSYGPRLPTLHLTLKALLEQTVIPDRIIVWISRHEMDAIPTRCRLFDQVVEFRPCDDVKSYKKLIFTVREHPDAYVVIADDDVYYHHRWLELLVGEVDPARTELLCHVAYRFHFEPSGRLAPYEEWSVDVQDMYARRPSIDLLPIGGGGVLFSPNALHSDCTDRSLFERLCPHGDDLWFYAMARLVGTSVRKIGPRLIQVSWPRSQDSALWRDNVPYRNDANIANLLDHYGECLFQT